MLSPLNRLHFSEISPMLRTGIRVRGTCLDFMYKEHQPPSRFAVIVSTKVDKRATKRNRMKRLVREATQLLLPSIREGVSGVFVVRSQLPDTIDAVTILVRHLFGQKHLLKETST